MEQSYAKFRKVASDITEFMTRMFKSEESDTARPPLGRWSRTNNLCCLNEENINLSISQVGLCAYQHVK